MSKKLFWGGFVGALAVVALIVGWSVFRGEGRMKELGTLYASWPTVTGKINFFTARFPSEPEYETQELVVPGSGDALQQEILVGGLGQMTFYVAATRYPAPLAGELEATLRTALDGMTATIPDVARVLSKFVVPFKEPHDYLDFTVETTGAARYKGRIYAAENSLYQVYAFYDAIAYDDDVYTYFVNSFSPEE